MAGSDCGHLRRGIGCVVGGDDPLRCHFCLAAQAVRAGLQGGPGGVGAVSVLVARLHGGQRRPHVPHPTGDRERVQPNVFLGGGIRVALPAIQRGCAPRGERDAHLLGAPCAPQPFPLRLARQAPRVQKNDAADGGGVHPARCLPAGVTLPPVHLRLPHTRVGVPRVFCVHHPVGDLDSRSHHLAGAQRALGVAGEPHRVPHGAPLVRHRQLRPDHLDLGSDLRHLQTSARPARGVLRRRPRPRASAGIKLGKQLPPAQ